MIDRLIVNRFVCFLLLVSAFGGNGFAQQSSQPSLTIYNQNFAVVRQQLFLDLRAGENQVNVNDITMHLEPDSVILRDPAMKHSVQVLEQNYRADPVSESLLLSLFEGKTIDFEAGPPQGPASYQRENYPQRLRAAQCFGDERLRPAILPIADGGGIGAADRRSGGAVYASAFQGCRFFLTSAILQF